MGPITYVSPQRGHRDVLITLLVRVTVGHSFLSGPPLSQQDVYRVELRDFDPYGIEAQFLVNGELFQSYRFFSVVR